MKIKWKSLLICVAIPLLVGALSALISRNGYALFSTVTKPPLSPPAWLFPVVWSILFILMGIASYLVYNADVTISQKENALKLYEIQLLFNFFWSVWFFNFRLYLFAFLWILALWILILTTTISFWRIQKKAGYLMLPYLAWVTFAAYLNLGIALLN